ncbi:MAG TPA: hypothetical protein VLT36_14270, partial [Candidatus Dormibacteraeota bacterium]|nr:hypothetical protein [Candidatus Dormibacteraeota bacterium]
QKALPPASSVTILLTGMGPRNAAKSIRQAITTDKPALVLTCGFAGGLRPDLKTGDILFANATDPQLATALTSAAAQPGRFHCAERVAVTAAEKQELRSKTGADAVEMESAIICAICRENEIPTATVRVILDPANEDLPLDFNKLMTADDELSYTKLSAALALAPGKIGALLRLQKQSQTAAQALARVLESVLKSST